MNGETITLDLLLSNSQAFPALCIGPGVTTLPAAHTEVRSKAIETLALQNQRFSEIIAAERGSFEALMDLLQNEDPELAAALRQLVINEIRHQHAPLDVAHLVKTPWSACVSLTEDLIFESALRNYLDTRPQSLAVTIVDSSTQLPPSRCLPVYKLLGNMEASSPEAQLALSASEILKRERNWPQIMRTCADYCRDAPLLFVGTHANQDVTKRFLSLISSQAKPSFSKLYFLKNESPLDDPTIRALCASFETHLIDATIRDVCTISGEKRGPVTASKNNLKINVPIDVKTLVERMSAFIAIVPSGQPATASDESTHIPQLIDALFRPSSLDWQPFQYDLDLRRSLTTKIVEDILEPKTSANVRSLLVRGDAATGKTTLMKRLATDIAKAGVLTLWCRRSLLGNWTRVFRDFCRDLSALSENNRKNLRIVVFCDDPWKIRIDAAELMRSFDSCPCPITFVYAVRNSDFFAGNQGESTLGIRLDDEFELGFELDSQEQELIKKLLVRLGVASDETHATKLFSELRTARTSDILSSLWYLVPETRFQLSQSLRDEYCRLGESRDRINELASSAASSSAIARRAYEFVTVTSSLNIGLPIEVLVRALGIQYQEWLDMSSNGRPLWGLLYDDNDENAQTILFWTRNEIVNRVLLELVNGGISTHAGEVRVLTDLLKACDTGSIVYREFVVDILVRARSKLESKLTYEQGLELYDVARISLPYPDRVLEHHKGIWMQKKGGSTRLTDAYTQLSQALEAPVYPGSEREARREHIHTSLAATVLDMVKDNIMETEKALELIQDHARHSSRTGFFNPHSSHVVAGLFFELSRRATDQPTAAATGISEALSEIDKALHGIGSSSRARAHYEKDVMLLSDLQRRILLSLPEGESLKDWALDIFSKSGQQVGFEAAARRMIDSAVSADKGREFNEARIFLEMASSVIRDSGKPLSPEMHAVVADLTIQWKIERIAGSVDWPQLQQELEAALASPRYKEDPLRSFYRAVCLFQQGRYTDANAIFAALRRQSLSAMLPAEPRCSYRGSEGMPRRLQGTLEHKHGQYYLLIQELGISVLSQRPERESGHGSTTHGYIVFSFNGPLAVYFRPEH